MTDQDVEDETENDDDDEPCCEDADELSRFSAATGGVLTVDASLGDSRYTQTRLPVIAKDVTSLSEVKFI